MTYLAKIMRGRLASHKNHSHINYDTKKNNANSLSFSALFAFTLSGCHSEQYKPDTHAINAANISNKSHYLVLAENKNKEPVSFNVLGNTAHMSGIMDSTITTLVRNLIHNYPGVDTIVMHNVLGTLDFAATLEAGRLIRDACLTTVVPIRGKITSGGVHLFMAGCKRITEKNAKLGIHTWQYPIYDENGNIIGGTPAADFPTDSSEHQMYLDYQAEMDIPADFYWRIVDTPFDKMHFLSKNEAAEFSIVNTEQTDWGANYRLITDSNTRTQRWAARFYVDNGIAIMHGRISERTASDLSHMLEANPDVHTLEFGVLQGNSQPNLHAINLGYAIRDACLTTKISKNSYAPATAFHSFIAGCKLELEDDREIGSIYWPKTTMEQLAFDASSELSTYYEYYEEMGIPQSRYQYKIPTNKPDFIEREDLMELGLL